MATKNVSAAVASAPSLSGVLLRNEERGFVIMMPNGRESTFRWHESLPADLPREDVETIDAWRERWSRSEAFGPEA